MKISIKTVRQSFSFGFSWYNEMSHEYRAAIIIGFLVIEFMWGKNFKDN